LTLTGRPGEWRVVPCYCGLVGGLAPGLYEGQEDYATEAGSLVAALEAAPCPE